MASSTHKHYHDEAFCCKSATESYFTEMQNANTEQHLGFPMRILHELFSRGHVKADKALDISFGSIVYQLFSLSNVCKEIYVLHLNKASLEHFKQWLEKGDRATDWSYVAKRACHLEGNRQGWKEKEEQVKKAVKGPYLWEDYGTSGVDPLLIPEVDCVVSLWILPAISKTKEEFIGNLKKCTSRLKHGGHLVLVMSLNMSFYLVGEHRYFVLSMTEAEVQESLIKAGLLIEKSELSAIESSDISDYSHLYFVLARNERQG